MKRGSKWQARITWRDENGKLHQKSKSGFETKQQAKQYAAKLESRRLAGDNVESSISFADYFDDWFNTYKKGLITPVTQRHYIWVANEINKYFGKIKIKKITRRQYQQFINDFGENHAPETVKKLNGICRACFRSAVVDGIITKDITENTTLVYDKNRKQKVEYLNIQELKLLISELLSKLNPRYTSRYMILTAIYTGARLGEIMALTWDDINFNFKTISISKAWDYHNGGGFKATKNEASVRIIRVNDLLLSCLKQLKENDEDMVFKNKRGEIPSSNAVNKTLRSCMKEVGVVKRGFHFHSLRHSHVAYLLSQGANLYAISKRLGHSDMTTTAKRYSYLIDEYKERSDNQIEGYLNGLNSSLDVQMMYKTKNG